MLLLLSSHSSRLTRSVMVLTECKGVKVHTAKGTFGSLQKALVVDSEYSPKQVVGSYLGQACSGLQN